MKNQRSSDRIFIISLNRFSAIGSCLPCSRIQFFSVLNTVKTVEYMWKKWLWEEIWQIVDLNVVNSGGLTGEISSMVVAVVHVGALWLVDLYQLRQPAFTLYDDLYSCIKWRWIFLLKILANRIEFYIKYTWLVYNYRQQNNNKIIPLSLFRNLQICNAGNALITGYKTLSNHFRFSKEIEKNKNQTPVYRRWAISEYMNP